MTSILRELIWLEIQKHPGSTVGQIENALNKKQGSGVSTYITQLYRARMIDRKQQLKAVANIAGSTLYYTYTVACKEYVWVSPGAAKKARAVKKGSRLPVALPINPAPTREAVIKAATSSVDLILAQLQTMSLRDVLKLKAGIDEALTV